MKIDRKESLTARQLPLGIEAMRARLAEIDSVLAVAHQAVGPFQWRVRECGFAGLVQLISAQQVSTASAAAIWKRFEAGVNETTSKRVQQFDLETLRSFGLSRPKAIYVKAIAEAEVSGAINFSHISSLGDETAIEKLTGLKG